MVRYTLGLAAHYHDSSACLLKDGIVISAAQEERFTRKKQDENFPINAVKYCLESEKITLEDISEVAYYEKPILKFERLLKTYIYTWPWGFRSFHKAMKTWLGQKLWIESEIRTELGALLPEKKGEKKKKKPQFQGKIYFVPHHLAHAASAYYASNFDSATVLTIDGVGEWATTTIGVGKGASLELKKEIHFPHSIGLLYSAFTYYLGFKVNSAEYKVMGLAPYGKPIYKDKIYEIINIFPDGSFELDMRYFSYQYALTMVKKPFAKHFGQPIRKGEDEPLTQFHKDMAASLQVVTEELVAGLVAHAYEKYPNKNLCLAGGVALNCVSNGKILRRKLFENVYIFPASGDSGGSFGAASFTFHKEIKTLKKESFPSAYLGPNFSNEEIKNFLKEIKVEFTEMKTADRAETIANYIAENKIVGHFSGRMEFGPRALGNRSILADPRNKENWQKVNLKIKFRESFRPFAPSVLAEKADDYFELQNVESPFMLVTAQTKNKTIPAVTHLDGSARIQTVSEEQNKKYYDLIKAFEKKTDCGVVINTSFNVRGEPIVCTPEDAFKGFVRTEMDVLVLEDFVIEAENVDKVLLRESLNLESFEAD